MSYYEIKNVIENYARDLCKESKGSMFDSGILTPQLMDTKLILRLFDIFPLFVIIFGISNDYNMLKHRYLHYSVTNR